MTIDDVINDYKQSVIQSELFIKTHQSMMEPSEIKEYRYYIARDNLAIDTMRKYQKIKEIVTNNELEWGNASVRANALLEVKKVVEDGKDDR